ncbi:MAG TPA: TIGR03086 family metal-binding protein [Jiangellaceae bacterium]|nr:TIGR03086 family metal-binding protein [Jiangellaceae bacterium]
MRTDDSAAPLVGALVLLECALSYTCGCLRLVTDDVGRPTPCRAWDLHALLIHMNDSLATLLEAAGLGYVDPDPADYDASAGIVATLHERAGSLLGAWTTYTGAPAVSVAGRPLSAGLLVCVGALEIVVHGWDVAQACGDHRPVPPLLAEELLVLAPLLVSESDRPSRFAAPVRVSPTGSASDRLLAFLGRQP